ncbi:Retrovirus-related Pol polyprotein from transposon RE1 [Vitis vinifera]|uniref:Retrovirus-related Pol polyprotein from transposon RE1 n=1 Tax=Vitis vinifera TaxID=29760 RepID=A0A438IWR7_VITVI|nr:Retrovirus-related Pol polyprotein from transposon RE1 [Vitis vinifera]
MLLKDKALPNECQELFLNEILSEEVYVEKPKGFEDPKFSNHVYKLKKALYEGKQAPIARYERLTTYLLEKKFEKMRVDKTLFIHRSKNELLLTQIYVDDIVFKATSTDLALSFVKEIKTEFEMCIVGELTFFLGL